MPEKFGVFAGCNKYQCLQSQTIQIQLSFYAKMFEYKLKIVMEWPSLKKKCHRPIFFLISFPFV